MTQGPAQASLRAGHKSWAGDFREEEKDQATHHPLPALHPFPLCSSRQGWKWQPRARAKDAGSLGGGPAGDTPMSSPDHHGHQGNHL